MTQQAIHRKLIERSNVHPDWSDILVDALDRVGADYLLQLSSHPGWLPGIDKLFSAFRRDRLGVRYVLLGESPYPRAASANGIAFYDAAVNSLWSDQGLSKSVNRATSLRNIIKTALLAEGHLEADGEGKVSQASIAGIDKSTLVQTMDELFANLHKAGFLMLNATPVLHPESKPTQEAVYWQDFLERLLKRLVSSLDHPLTLVLWGKIAKALESMNPGSSYRILASEHPYNISFINNSTMQSLFRDIRVLSKRGVSVIPARGP
ncbi:MAG: uracil-DNA glycosylase family protein [Gammaproteobacteria bacterium]